MITNREIKRINEKSLYQTFPTPEIFTQFSFRGRIKPKKKTIYIFIHE